MNPPGWQKVGKRLAKGWQKGWQRVGKGWQKVDKKNLTFIGVFEMVGTRLAKGWQKLAKGWQKVATLNPKP